MESTVAQRLTAMMILVLIAMSSGCKEDEQNYSLYFSHENHVNSYDASCADCHGEAENGRFAKPSHASCVDCHDDWIETKKISEKTCGQCHKARDLDALSQLEVPEPMVKSGGVFIHSAELANRCADCHGSIFGEKLFKVPPLNRSEIVRIREKAHGWNMDCSACHVNMDRETPPGNHDENWMRRHGALGTQPDNACSVCHQEQSCRECHQEMMPQSHNNLWRYKTHGIQAAWDRSRCQVCHEEDSCSACHAEVRPKSHNANWERTHCTQCHASSATGTGCALCHESGLDAHPNPHPAGWISGHCRNCHNGSPQSEQCQICHTGFTLNSHPDPHPAGWRQGHCQQCHQGNINGISCSDCHQGNLINNHPNPHNTGFVRTHCNNCHENSTLNGVSCKECHGGDLTANHPNPHAAGFKRSHCNSCHAGSQAAQQCEICHEGGSSVLVHEDFWPPVHNRFGDQANCADCHF